MRDVKLCISHNPDAVELKRAATRKGGRNRRTPRRPSRPAKPVAVRKIEDVQKLLFQTLEELRNGLIDADVARSVGYLAGVAAKVFESVEVERRVTRLEDTAMEMSEAQGV